MIKMENDNINESVMMIQKKDERWKGVLYINLYGILFAVCLLLA